MAESDDSADVAFQVKYETGRPVELADLGESFRALGKQYEDYVHRHGFDQQAGNARLYVAELRTGSILLILKNMLEQGSMVLKDLDVLAGFITNLYELVDYFRTTRPTPPAEITREEAGRLSRIVEPAAKDGTGALSLTLVGNTGPITINNILINNETANAIQNNVRRFLGPSVPDPGSFQREVLYLQQMRGDPNSKVGDRGVIERFSTKPVKLHFMTPEAKAAVLDRPYPFKAAHVIDGQVSTVKGEPALYKVTNVHETLGAVGKQKQAKKPTRRVTVRRAKNRPYPSRFDKFLKETLAQQSFRRDVAVFRACEAQVANYRQTQDRLSKRWSQTTEATPLDSKGGCKPGIICNTSVVRNERRIWETAKWPEFVGSERGTVTPDPRIMIPEA
jgi:hypothetical protein